MIANAKEIKKKIADTSFKYVFYIFQFLLNDIQKFCSGFYFNCVCFHTTRQSKYWFSLLKPCETENNNGLVACFLKTPKSLFHVIESIRDN